MSKLLPIHRMTKKELIWMDTHRCVAHHHSYLEHQACYLKERGTQEKIGFFDIETSNLDADFGIMLSYCILDNDTDEVLSGVISPADIFTAKEGDEDRVLVEQCVKDLMKFDKVVGYYSKRFDLPYVRARALVTGVSFPSYGSIIHIDLYDLIKSKFKLSSRRLENACRVLLGHTTKNRIDAKYWRAGTRGDEKSLAYILDHNTRDVRDLKELYEKTLEFGRKNDTSI